MPPKELEDIPYDSALQHLINNAMEKDKVIIAYELGRRRGLLTREAIDKT